MIRRQPGERFNAVNMPARFLVTFANQLQAFQLVDAPDWLGNERFDIIAKMEGEPPPVPPVDPNASTIFTAVQEQLGLNLSPQSSVLSPRSSVFSPRS